MSLIYRAIWQDHANGIHRRALDAFAWWVNLRNPGTRTFETDVEESVGGAVTLVRSGSNESGAIQRCTVHVDDGKERRTTTLITTSTTKPIGSVWVDQERVSRDAFAPFQVRAPELSTRLIAQGRDPRRGPIKLSTKPATHRPDSMQSFVDLLTDPERDLPIVLFATGPGFDASSCLKAGIYAAMVLAGSAAVHLVDAERLALIELIGADLSVTEGGARVYLPGFSLDDADPWRHRSLEADRVSRDPEAVAHTVVQLLAPATASRRAPVEYPVLRHLLQAGPAAHHDEVESLHARLAEYSDQLTHAERRNVELEDQLVTVEGRELDLLADLAESEQRVNDLQDRLVGLLTSGRIEDPATAKRHHVEITCCSDAARAAKTELSGIVLPDDACHDLDELDHRLEARTWGQTSWRAFTALHAFALDTSYKPGFWEWCVAARSPLTWPASSKKLAMRESESVIRIEELRAKRIFPIDPRVEPTGKILMEAHLKVAEGGGPQIPRIYFYDDRHGPTGKVHIGFFGPHHLLPTSTYR